MLKALIFDFDGLVIETEEPVFRSWQETYREFGFELSEEEYAACIGGSYNNAFDPYRDLEERSGRAIDWDAVTLRRRERQDRYLAGQKDLPGVRALMDEARKRRLGIAIASSSPRDWIDRLLPQTGVQSFVDHIVTVDDTGRTKPDPALFLTALSRLGTAAGETVVLEDSPNGCLAAQHAGIFCVIAPNRLTRLLSFPGPHHRVHSLEELTVNHLQQLLDPSSTPT